MTPLELNVHLSATDGVILAAHTRYRYIVGTLVYLAIISCIMCIS